MKWPWDRGGLRTYLLLAALLCARPEQRLVLWGLPLLLPGLLLQVYAKGCLEQNRALAQAGPYRFVRHPFYAANLLIDQGLAVMSGSVPLMLALPVWWLAVYLPVMRHEERELTRLFPESYPNYRARVPMLIPFRRPLLRAEGGFSWRTANITADTVLPRALRLAALPLFFVIWREARLHGLNLLHDAGGVATLSAAALASTYGISWQLQRHLKHRRRLLPSAAAGAGFRLLAAVLVLAAAGSVRVWEIESNQVVSLVGLVSFPASVVLSRWRGAGRLAAEGLALAGAVVLCEVPWLAPLPLLLWTALLLDSRLPLPGPQHTPDRPSRLPRLVHALAYQLILTAGLAVALAKEVVA
jgi:hypothetical protein